MQTFKIVIKKPTHTQSTTPFFSYVYEATALAWFPSKAEDGREQFPRLCVSLRLPGTDTLGAKTGAGGGKSQSTQ